MFLLFCGLSVVSGTGWKLLLRAENASTVAASRHPDHHPAVTSASPNPCGLPTVYQTSYELRAWLTVYLLRSIGDSRRSASPSAP